MKIGYTWIKGPQLILSDDQSFEEGAHFVLGDDRAGGVGPTGKRLHITVAEEKAIDSYNTDIQCSLSATMDQARQLRDWLNGLDLSDADEAGSTT